MQRRNVEVSVLPRYSGYIRRAHVLLLAHSHSLNIVVDLVRALDSRWAGREFDSHAAAALSGNNLGQVVHTNVPLFAKQYNLVPCEGLYA